MAVRYDEDILDAHGKVQTNKPTPIAFVDGEYGSPRAHLHLWGAAKASGRR